MNEKIAEQRLFVAVPKEIKSKLKKRAKGDRVSIAEVVREALVVYLR